ncbi:Sedlin [Geranomyces variabilis]|nr:Sedlin [Geranomyces variabilis]KAJ3141070.1 Trafficking protein particle complex subunit 2-like protein [Geranomyces variabilis]
MPFDVICIAVIGKTNNPLYIKNCSRNAVYPDLKCHYIAHTAIDLVEEKSNHTQNLRVALLASRILPDVALPSHALVSTTKHADQYLGLLYALEELAVFGYITNTRVKFIVVTSLTDAAIKDQEMKALFRKIHNAYVALVSNPFWDPDAQRAISSPNFDRAIAQVAAGSSS